MWALRLIAFCVGLYLGVSTPAKAAATAKQGACLVHTTCCLVPIMGCGDGHAPG